MTTFTKTIYTLLLLATLLLTGCANAGKDQKAHSGDTVTLDGSKSKADFFGEIKKYQWKQVKHKKHKVPKVVLSDKHAMSPTFVAPTVTKETVLVFRLMTMERGGYYSPWKTKDQVIVVVNPMSTENKLPQALVTVSSQNIKEGQSVTFDASDSNDSDGEIVSYEWKNANGIVLGSEVVLEHTFATVGTHTVTLTVTDNEEGEDTTTVSVTVVALQPSTAEINASATAVFINNVVTFDANGSNDADGEIISYTWKDAQGNALSNHVQFTHSFEISGEHNITLIVMDDDEQIATAMTIITVQAELLSVSLSIDNASLEVNETTTLQATANYNDNTTEDVTSSIEWIVSDTTLISIDNNGTLKALQDGTVTITARVGEVDSNTVSVEIIPQDTTAPTLTLNGEADLTLMLGTPYTELGATATDDRDENVSIDITGNVDVNTVGTYTITYTSKDKAGNSASIQRAVNVLLPPDVTAPVITLNGENTVTVFQDTSYVELGATATDDRDTNVSVSISGNVDSATLGSYTITYTATDTASNSATVQRTINVVLPPDTEAPVITLNGDVNITLTLGESYEELGATASDVRDGDVNVTITGSVDTSTEGTYTITYTARDKAGNEATATRIVTVVAPTFTNISLESNVTTLNVGEKAGLTVLAIYSDGSTLELDANVEYIITPSDSVEVNGTVLRAKKDGTVTVQAKVNGVLSNTLNLNITWVVNGHVLPPEPDKTLNDSTLLGIDVNDNGVRDDVERWIYEMYDHPIERGVFMQLSKALQYRIGHADEAWKYRQPTSDAVTCSSYWEDPSPYPIRINNYKTPADELRPIQHNTQLRKSDNDAYQKALSGGVIEDNGLDPEEWIEKCHFDANDLMKDYK